jgi:hypothetical protein
MSAKIFALDRLQPAAWRANSSAALASSLHLAMIRPYAKPLDLTKPFSVNPFFLVGS